MNVLLQTYKQLAQWGWDSGLLSLVKDGDTLAFLGGIGLLNNKVERDVDALEVLAEEAGVWEVENWKGERDVAEEAGVWEVEDWKGECDGDAEAGGLA